MKRYIKPEPSTWAELVKRPAIPMAEIRERVSNILSRVQLEGDKALRELTLALDKVELDELVVSEEEFQKARNLVADDLKLAIDRASKNISAFHEAQFIPEMQMETMPGVECMRKSVPIERVGLYIPGGSAPLFSTVLMLAIPAKIAGCEEIVLCTPPGKNDAVHPAILYAAEYTGITKVIKVGGAQAIAAMAYGTETVPKVDKIFGPGNQYVTAAKQLVSLDGVAIDMPAGPSEVLVLADESSDMEFVASDLLSQAEHGPDSQVVLVTKNEELVDKVNEALEQQLDELPRRDIAQKALENSFAVVLPNEEQAMDFINLYAPEHLIFGIENADSLIDRVKNAGSVFLGQYTPESAGDYASGTNHTLPTNGYARAYSGVSLDSFMKKITFQKITADGLTQIGPFIEVMAQAEQLDGHRKAVNIRLKKIKA